MDDIITSALSECRSSWAAFFAEHKLSKTAITFSDGTPIMAWCLHHEVRCEPLYEPIENRVSYILSEKPEEQRAVRFLNLRPMSRESIAATVAARAEYEKVEVAARAEYEKVVAPAGAEYEKVEVAAWAEYEKVVAPARAEYLKAVASAGAEHLGAKASALAEYEKATAPAWAEYEKVVAPARAEYEKVVAPAWAEHLGAKASALAEYDKAADNPHLRDVPHHTWNGESIFPRNPTQVTSAPQ